MASLVNEFEAFLKGVKTSEAISPELRTAITVDTGLVAVLVDALKAGRDVIIAGSVSDEEAKKIYPNGWKAPRPYIRIVPQPEAVK